MIFGSTKELVAPLEKKLKEHGQDVIVAQLRHCRLFGGGLHCATLDMVRDEKCETYF